jgi:hypothetical protein
VRRILKDNPSEMLQGAFTWTPMLEKDDLASGNRAENKYSDTRITHYWDSEKILGGLLSKTLNIKRTIAWDVYLLYQPKHDWISEMPPTPEFWMHQLTGENPSLRLDPLVFQRKVNTMIQQFNQF